MTRRANDHFVDKAAIFFILFAAAMRDDTAVNGGAIYRDISLSHF
jgi:hypothetical protein